MAKKKKKSLTFGSYYPVPSLIHSLDGRGKLVAVFLFLITVFFCNNFIMFGAMYLFAFAVILLSRVPVGTVLRSIRVILWLALLTGVLNAFFIQGEILWQWKFLALTKEGLELGILMVLRLILLVAFASVLTFTTTPVELTDSIESLLKPLKVIKVPAHDLALMISIALRFIPILMQEVDIITKAQRSRGADFSNVKNIVALIVPLFASAIGRAADLALAMEARGYNGGEGRTKFHQMKWQTRDTLFIAITVIFCIFMVIWRYAF